MGKVIKQGQRGSRGSVKFKGCQEEGIKGINTGQEWVKRGSGVSRGSQRVQKGSRRF